MQRELSPNSGHFTSTFHRTEGLLGLELIESFPEQLADAIAATIRPVKNQNFITLLTTMRGKRCATTATRSRLDLQKALQPAILTPTNVSV
jgi:hypothetical protein